MFVCSIYYLYNGNNLCISYKSAVTVYYLYITYNVCVRIFFIYTYKDIVYIKLTKNIRWGFWPHRTKITPGTYYCGWGFGG